LGHSNLLSALGIYSFLWFNFCRCFRDGGLQISSVQRYIMKKLDLANENEVIYSDVATLPFLLLIIVKKLSWPLIDLRLSDRHRQLDIDHSNVKTTVAIHSVSFRVALPWIEPQDSHGEVCSSVP